MSVLDLETISVWDAQVKKRAIHLHCGTDSGPADPIGSVEIDGQIVRSLASKSASYGIIRQEQELSPRAHALTIQKRNRYSVGVMVSVYSKVRYIDVVKSG